jgi:hypothetical protein
MQAHSLYYEHISSHFSLMVDKVDPSLHTLPAELVHRILNSLDDFNIFYTVRNVCQRLDTIVDGYRRYKVNAYVLKEDYDREHLSLLP